MVTKKFTEGKVYRLNQLPIGSLVKPYPTSLISYDMTLDSLDIVEKDGNEWLPTTHYEHFNNKVYPNRLMKSNMRVLLIKLPENHE